MQCDFSTYLLCCVTAFHSWSAFGQSTLRVVDHDDNPVEQFSVMIHTADHGYENWKEGAAGSCKLQLGSYPKAANIDLIVRAAGYASVVRSFQGVAKKALIEDGGTIALNRGREVQLKLLPPEGMDLPHRFQPTVYFPGLAWRVEVMWQPENSHVEHTDFNMLNVRPVRGSAGEFSFRLSDEQSEFIVAVHQPDWLRFFKAGPFDSDGLTDNTLTVNIPAPAAIRADLKWERQERADLPFNGLHYRLMRQQHKGGNSYLSVSSVEKTLDDTSFRATDLAPGHYLLQVRTTPKEPVDRWQDSDINPGRFFARTSLDLEPEQVITKEFNFVPFDAQANLGERTAHIRVVNTDGLAAVGKKLRVGWFDGHYGRLTVFEGQIPGDGVVRLEGISDDVPTEAPFGPYSVEMEGETLGFFRVQANEGAQEFSFRIVPKVGDVCPNIELVALDSGDHLLLNDLRGRAAFLEFWETGCGPCQPSMTKLNELVGTYGDQWRDKLVVLPIALDANADIIASHVKSRGWSNLVHYRSKHSDGSYFADAAREFVIHGVPTAILIDRDGKIVWRGHPGSFELPKEAAKLRVK